MNYYDILGLSETSEPEVIEAAYRALMKKYHPDRWSGGSAEAERRTKLINEAYSALRDPRRRREYDRTHPTHASRTPDNERPKQQTASRPARPRFKPAPVVQPRRVSAPPGGNRFSFSFGRSEVIGAAIVLLGVFALGGVASRSSTRAHLAGTQTLLLPPASALLGRTEQQVFCITNKTLHPIEYTVYWGDTEAHSYEINAGTSMLHYSRLSGSPVVEYLRRDGPVAGVPRKRIRARVSSTSDRSCTPNYSFEYEDADIARWSQYDRFGLYHDDPAEVAPDSGDPAQEPS